MHMEPRAALHVPNFIVNSLVRGEKRIAVQHFKVRAWASELPGSQPKSEGSAGS